MRIPRRAIWVVIVLVFLVVVPYSALAQSGEERTFPDGGSLSGEWLAAWEATSDPLLEYGPPITGVMTSVTGEKVLYTSQARFRQTASRIVVDPLGSMLYTPGKPANFSLNTGACRVHRKTGYHICYAFLQFYISHFEMLGDPLSDPEEMNGRIVQAFEYGWLEWRPENQAGQRVLMMDLGRVAYDLWERGQQNLNVGDRTIAQQVPISAFAFVEHAILPAGTEQTLFVIARTPDFEPVADAAVDIQVNFPDGRKQGFSIQYTDADGIAKFNLPVSGLEDGQTVLVEVVVTYRGSSVKAATSFIAWH